MGLDEGENREERVEERKGRAQRQEEDGGWLGGRRGGWDEGVEEVLFFGGGLGFGFKA